MKGLHPDSIWICLCELKSVRLDRYRDEHGWNWHFLSKDTSTTHCRYKLKCLRFRSAIIRIVRSAGSSKDAASDCLLQQPITQYTASVLISIYFPQTSCREYIAKSDVLDEWHGLSRSDLKLRLASLDFRTARFASSGVHGHASVLHTSAAAVGNSNLRSIGLDCWHPLACLYGDVLKWGYP